MGDHPLIAPERAAGLMGRFRVAVLVHQLATEGAHVGASFFIEEPVNEAGGVSHDPAEHTAWADCVNGANVLLGAALALAAAP